MQITNYSVLTTMLAYRCRDCGRHGVKLWRLPNVMVSHQVLRCARCAGRNQDHDIRTLDRNGCSLNTTINLVTDMIGNLLPAVPSDIDPDEGEITDFWSRSATPDIGVRWWRSLPSK